MSTKIEKYELVRSMSDEEFAAFSKIMTGGKQSIFEYIEHYGKYAIAALLAYVAYDNFSCSETINGWLTAISSGLMFLYKTISSFLSSTIYTIDIVKNKKYDDALELVDMANNVRRRQVENHIENLEKLEDEHEE